MKFLTAIHCFLVYIPGVVSSSMVAKCSNFLSIKVALRKTDSNILLEARAPGVLLSGASIGFVDLYGIWAPNALLTSVGLLECTCILSHLFILLTVFAGCDNFHKKILDCSLLGLCQDYDKLCEIMCCKLDMATLSMNIGLYLAVLPLKTGCGIWCF
ncbi:hypothetical protein ACH5RR_035330 [Cinchona calisaya]|uniref:Uncharacterized protein n=1 Tax=Cinchona calisaya TaxID=153742 RepID=A0ABD2YGQ2_9GENT